MTKASPKDYQDYIQPLNINGMQGRMLHLPAPNKKQREMLFVYGHHSSLERWRGLMEVLNKYGAVTMPDLPGFGGMETLYKIGQQPDIDTLADYLAAFIKLRFKRKRITLVGMSFGFVIATRMLQRYPEMTKNVEMLVSLVGFSHKDDFTFSRKRMIMYRSLASIFTHRVPAIIFRYIGLNSLILKTVYQHTHNAKQKFQGVVGEELKEITDFEIGLWHSNDVRTYMKTTTQFLKVDNCRQRIDLAVYHVSAKADRYFSEQIVEQHLRVIFSDFHKIAMPEVGNHAPSVIADAEAAAPYIPPGLRRLLNKS